MNGGINILKSKRSVSKKILTVFVQKRKNPNKRKNTIENFVVSDGIF